MQERQEIQNKFGLVGKDISYSFSAKYFTQKFNDLNLHNNEYVNFDIESIDEFLQILKHNPNLKGLNVTIPYKEQVIPFLDKIDSDAKKIGAVNTIKILSNSKLKGYNTDFYGFENSLLPYVKKYHKKALILGTGGASKAIKFVLNKLEIESKFVSRNPKKSKEISYSDLTDNVIKSHKIIINCTPIGTYPNIDQTPDIPYKYITSKHLLYDLIYNPSQTTFLKKGLQQKCTAINGLKMLELQAEKSWQIWNDK